jgi:hypothetical protein
MEFNLPETAVCLNCRYMLRGLENPVCPECGQEFDPQDPRTYFYPLKRGVCYRWTHPPRNYLRYILIVWTVASLYLATNPGSSLYRLPTTFLAGLDALLLSVLPIRFAFAMCFICLAMGLQHAAMWVLKRRLRKYEAPPPVSRLMKWWWTPLCVGLVLSTMLYAWPAWIGFQLSRSSLEVAAVEQLAIGTGEIGYRICGGYLLDSVRVYSAGPHDVVFLRIAGTNGAGFIYSPDPTWERNFANPMGGHWYYTHSWP